MNLLNNPICFAADFPTLNEAADFVNRHRLDEKIGKIKVGLELFIANGPRAVREFMDMSLSVVLDLKLHDIPETVARAVKTAGDIGATHLTLHIQQMATLEKAVRAAEPYGIQLLGVSVLTSMTIEDCDDLEFGLNPIDPKVSDRVLSLIKFAYTYGLTGFVCSPQEVKAIRKRFSDVFLLVPGIRMESTGDDQKRVGTPRQAMADGATSLVIGRPIRDAKDPRKAVQDILQSIQDNAPDSKP